MLTDDQNMAFELIKEFVGAEAGSSFLLEGGAGVGKTYLLGLILQYLQSRNEFNPPVVCVAAPTHKAINVLRRKLDGFGVEWCLGYDSYVYNGTDVITGTTAALLGVRPVIVDDQSTEVKFGNTGKGILSKVMPQLLIIDEVSMLSKADFMSLRTTLKAAGSKIIAIGDRGQLPPVKKEAIVFDLFTNKATLRQIVRQAADSAIIQFAWAIREGRDYTKIFGKGLTRVDYLPEEFMERLEDYSVRSMVDDRWKIEEERPVFIAYTNRRVNEVQDCACMKLYGHKRDQFAPGELVLSESNYYKDKVMFCANQDELIVEQFDEAHRDPVIGIPVVLSRTDIRGKFVAHYLPPEEHKDKGSRYNLELEARRGTAEAFAHKCKALAKRSGSPEYDEANRERRKAWAAFFEWRDQTVISFRHPFAVTSHKSQGSTYKTVFADTTDLARFSMHALYVAVTRPREELLISKTG